MFLAGLERISVIQFLFIGVQDELIAFVAEFFLSNRIRLQNISITITITISLFLTGLVRLYSVASSQHSY